MQTELDYGILGTAGDSALKPQQEISPKELAEIGEALLSSGIMPDQKYLDAMGLSAADARGMWAVLDMGKQDAATHSTPNSATTDYYVGPNGKVLPSQYKDWIGTNMQKDLLAQVENPKLNNAIKQLYRGSSFIDDGGTAGVIRFEKSTGLMLGKDGNSHIKKGTEMTRYIEKLILTQDLSSSDLAMAKRLLEDLYDALGR